MPDLKMRSTPILRRRCVSIEVITNFVRQVTEMKTAGVGIGVLLIAAAAGCNPHVQVEGGDRPIKIDMTVTLKIDQQLDQFFAFEKKYEPSAATQPASATQTTTTGPS